MTPTGEIRKDDFQPECFIRVSDFPSRSRL